MTKIVDSQGAPIVTSSDSIEDKIINSFFCGQIQSLHYLIHFLFKSKKKYDMAVIIRFIEARYLYLIREYPNYYNTVLKNDKELGLDAAVHYKKVLTETLEFFKSISERDADV